MTRPVSFSPPIDDGGEQSNRRGAPVVDFRTLPGPSGIPGVGVVGDIRKDPLGYFVGLQKEYGAMVPYRVGLDSILMLNAPQHIRHVLQDRHENYRKSKFYQPLRPILGDGIFLSEGASWLSQRRTLNKGFHGPDFDVFAQKIVTAAQSMIDRWEGYCDRGDSIDVAAEMMHIALDGVARALFNLRIDGDHKDIYDGLTQTLGDAERRVWSIFPTPRWLPTSANRAYKKALARLDAITYRIIAQRRADPSPPDDMLSGLIEAYGDDRAGDRLLRDQVLSVLLSGHETTANALAWVWYVLARHPDIEQRVRQEVDALGDAPLGFDTLQKLSYTSRVFEETLRLYPPVWTLSRQAIEDDEIGAVRVPKGTVVMVSPYVVHRNPELWENPNVFDPDRFLPGRAAGRPRLAYFPFGGGPRVCLGNRFAMMEAPLVIAAVTQRFHLSQVAPCIIAPEPMITLRPKGGVKMSLRRRRP